MYHITAAPLSHHSLVFSLSFLRWDWYSAAKATRPAHDCFRSVSGRSPYHSHRNSRPASRSKSIPVMTCRTSSATCEQGHWNCCIGDEGCWGCPRNPLALLSACFFASFSSCLQCTMKPAALGISATSPGSGGSSCVGRLSTSHTTPPAIASAATHTNNTLIPRKKPNAASNTRSASDAGVAADEALGPVAAAFLASLCGSRGASS